ncbi:cellulase family glycosylhydrolase [Candidatus Saccharibacteria bacterium]|nr:cellulase family glycosylhydrolase [Candidatus Saccharibacteria bacterium]
MRRYLTTIAKIALYLFTFFGLSFLVLYLLLGRGGEAEEIAWGVSFDPYYAEGLGLDWRETYLSLLDEVGVDHLRLVAFWNAVEPRDDEFDFERLDFQIQEAERRGAKVILAVGRRLPRWPECHIPEWALTMTDKEQQEEVLELVLQIVNRYKDSPALEFWQLENEQFVWFFGECPGPSAPLVKREIELIRELDPDHQFVLTESGELSTWFRVTGRGDYIGISMYRIIYDGNYTKLYLSYRPFFPQWYYRIKANFYKGIGRVKEVFISELQGEPWGHKPLTEMTLEEQYRTLSPGQFRYNLDFARSTGFDRIYLWGAEWWFYAKEKLGIPDFLDTAKELWN